MKKIIISGCGHGGLVCAYMLSQNGFDVTVYEKNEKENMGHDWCDCIGRRVLSEIGFNESDFNLKPFDDICYFSPDRTILIKTHKDFVKDLAYIDRKELIYKLISRCEECGVKFVFGANIKCAVIKDRKIAGITYIKDNEEKSVFGDIVIDSAGMHSPVRKSLPDYTGIIKEIPEKYTFNVYRAYFERKNFPSNYPKYSVFLFHKGNAGLDWVIRDDDFTDVLIGSFGALKESTIETSLKDFRKHYKCLGEKILRGGTVAQIPLRRPLPIFTFDGYVALGDSASMVEPLSGSGITLSLQNGKNLAEFILSSGEEFNTKEKLYEFQYTFLKEKAPVFINDNIVKETLTNLGATAINKLFTKNVIGVKELDGGTLDFKDYFDKVTGVLTTSTSIIPLLNAVKRMAKGKKIIEAMPTEYNEENVLLWAKKYEEI